MTKIARRIATAGVSAALAGAALLATGGSALAATDHLDTRTPAHAAVTEKAMAPAARPAHHPDAWIAGQLAMVTPWISDQLTLFAPSHDTSRARHSN
ncbi:hypothetical protein ABZ865_32505 [Streptomyces sp. NPDC047085]|uniref:hypothetical protein n=1 Tax=Streptomyces sp. NPDC047085 TaxID=3155140 RepID=UPI0033FAD9E1